MTYIEMDDEMPDHPVIAALSDRAYRMWSSSVCWCSNKRTDGIVPASMARRWVDATPAQITGTITELVDARRWHAAGHDCLDCAQPPAGQYVVHHFASRNRTKAEIEELAEKRRRAGAAGGRRSGATRRGRSGAEANASASAGGDAERSVPSGSSVCAAASNSQLSTAAAAAGDAAAAAKASHPASQPPPAPGPEPDEPEIVILRQKLDAAGLVVVWNRLTAEQRALVVQLVHRHSDGPLVKAALTQRAAHANPPAYASAWLNAWASLPEPGRRLAAVPEPRCREPGHETFLASGCPACRSEAIAQPDRRNP